MTDEFYNRCKEIGLKAAFDELEAHIILRSVFEFRFKTQACRILKLQRTTYIEKLRKATLYKPSKKINQKRDALGNFI